MVLQIGIADGVVLQTELLHTGGGITDRYCTHGVTDRYCRWGGVTDRVTANRRWHYGLI